jgi:hypothetical protein
VIVGSGRLGNRRPRKNQGAVSKFNDWLSGARAVNASALNMQAICKRDGGACVAVGFFFVQRTAVISIEQKQHSFAPPGGLKRREGIAVL